MAGVEQPFANGGPAAAPTAALQERNPASDPAEPGSMPAGAAGADEQYVMRCAPFLPNEAWTPFSITVKGGMATGRGCFTVDDALSLAAGQFALPSAVHE